MIGYLFLFTAGTYIGVKVGFSYKQKYQKNVLNERPSNKKDVKEIIFELNEYAYSKNISDAEKSRILWSLSHRIEKDLREQYDHLANRINKNI